MKGVFFFLGLTFYCLISSAQESVPKRLNDIKPNRQLTNFLELNSAQQTKPKDTYQLILSHGKWYAIGNGDGQVFTPENGFWISLRSFSIRLQRHPYEIWWIWFLEKSRHVRLFS
jgi:hypothetical protein